MEINRILILAYINKEDFESTERARVYTIGKKDIFHDIYCDKLRTQASWYTTCIVNVFYLDGYIIYKYR